MPHRRLAVLQPPAGVGAGPVRRHRAAGTTRRRAHRPPAARAGARGSRRRTPRRRSVRPKRPGPPAIRFAPSRHEREVHVPAVADAGHGDLRRERRAEAVPHADRRDRRCAPAPRCRPRPPGPRRRPRARADPARTRGGTARPTTPCRPGPRAGRGSSRRRRPAGPSRTPARARPGRSRRRLADRTDHPLDLERGLHGDAPGGQRRRRAGQQQPAALVVRRAVLLVAVAGRPGPPGRTAQRHHPAYVGHDPLVADGLAPGAVAGDPVVEAEAVEGRREPDAPRGQVRQPAERHGLDPGDAGVVHEGRRHARPRRARRAGPSSVDGGGRAGVALGLVQVGDVLHTRIVGSPHRVGSSRGGRRGHEHQQGDQHRTPSEPLGLAGRRHLASP